MVAACRLAMRRPLYFEVAKSNHQKRMEIERLYNCFTCTTFSTLHAVCRESYEKQYSVSFV
jgi:hypothetical protein